jgi:plasmid stabilization system protein ParE
MRLRVATKARRQLAAVSDYIAVENPGAAQRVIRDIQVAADLLCDFPEIGRAGIVPGTREWVVSGRPYIIVYRTDAERGELQVIEIIHGAQDRSKGGA